MPDVPGNEKGRLALDLLKGAVAGAAAVWAMDRLGWALWNREDPRALARERAARVEGMDPAHVVANRVADAVGRPLHPRQPHPAGIAVHYGIGMGPAMAYAVLRRRVPALRAGRADWPTGWDCSSPSTRGWCPLSGWPRDRGPTLGRRTRGDSSPTSSSVS